MGRPTEIKHRQAIFQQLCAQIAREAQDEKMLAAAGARAMSHNDVVGDGELAQMLRGFIASRHAELRVEAAERDGTAPDDTQLRTAFKDTGAPAPKDLADTIVGLEHARLEFDEHVVHFDEIAAERALTRVRDLTQRYPDLINPVTLERCDQAMADLRQRCDKFRRQIDGLAEQAVTAAHRGHTETAGWALRRLSAIHALRPALLPDERYEAIRDRIEGSGQLIEHQEFARELIGRERAIAHELRHLAVTIRKFQYVASRVLPSDPVYREAESEYRRAVRELQAHDGDWMSGLAIELHTLVEDMHDRTGQAAHQADHFIDSVRDSLQRLRQEIGASL